MTNPLCFLPDRVVVVTEELVANRDYLSAQEQGCVAMPFWVLVSKKTGTAEH